MTRRSLIAVSVVLGLLVGSVGIASAITNGRPDGDAHPYVGLLVFDAVSPDGAVGPAWRCSGALLSPRVVLTAGHCTDGAVAARVWFDEGPIPAIWDDPPGEYPYGGRTSYEGIPITNPHYCSECGQGLPGFAYRDVGIVVLTERVPKPVVGEYTELPEVGLVDTLANKTPIDFVGYGVQYQVGTGIHPYWRWTGLRVRLYAPSELVSGEFGHSDEFMKLALNDSQGTGGTCFGDSGGPDLLGGSDTVLAVNSYVTNANCSGVGYSSRVDIPEILAWIDGFLK